MTRRAAPDALAWMDAGACRGTADERFFPEQGDTVEPARAACMACPVREMCLEYALTNNERFGIWGGLSERERRQLRRQRTAGTSARPGPRTTVSDDDLRAVLATANPAMPAVTLLAQHWRLSTGTLYKLAQRAETLGLVEQRGRRWYPTGTAA